jgi:molybdate transport system regulatory protein
VRSRTINVKYIIVPAKYYLELMTLHLFIIVSIKSPVVASDTSAISFLQPILLTYQFIFINMSKQSLKTILNKKLIYKIRGTLWIECKGQGFLGPGRVELMQRIEKIGSINKAAAEMGMSYKKAWEMINALNTQAAKPLVITQTGGEKGGGSTITEEAKNLIAYHAKLRERFLVFLEKETKNLNLS